MEPVEKFGDAEYEPQEDFEEEEARIITRSTEDGGSCNGAGE